VADPSRTGKTLAYVCAAPRIATHPDAEISGPRAHILGIIAGWEAQGCQVKTFIVGDRMPKQLSTKKMETSLSGNPLKSALLDVARLVLGWLNARRAWNELHAQVDLIYERFSPFAVMGRRFKRRGIPWVVETHAPLFYEGQTERKTTTLTWLAQQLELQAYRECDAIVCVSEALKQIILKETGLPESKIMVIPNGVDLDRFQPDRVVPKRMFLGFTVGFVGRLYAWHGLGILLDSLAELRQEGLDISLTVVGDGLSRADLEAQAQALGIHDSVQFVGQKPWQEVAEYIAGFDVGYVGNIKMQVGSMYHSPLKLYEYMAMEKPVVASAFDDARRVIQEGKTGFLFEPGDKQAIKRALRAAYARKHELEMMGQAARQEILANHSWTARADAMLTQLDKILG